MNNFTLFFSDYSLESVSHSPDGDSPEIGPDPALLSNDQRTDKPKKCFECAFTCATTPDLHLHISDVHTNHQCSHCKRIYARQFQLKHHINNVHLKIHRFKCGMCSYSSYFSFPIRKHMRVFHSIEGPILKIYESKLPTTSEDTVSNASQSSKPTNEKRKRRRKKPVLPTNEAGVQQEEIIPKITEQPTVETMGNCEIPSRSYLHELSSQQHPGLSVTEITDDFHPQRKYMYTDVKYGPVIHKSKETTDDIHSHRNMIEGFVDGPVIPKVETTDDLQRESSARSQQNEEMIALPGMYEPPVKHIRLIFLFYSRGSDFY